MPSTLRPATRDHRAAVALTALCALALGACSPDGRVSGGSEPARQPSGPGQNTSIPPTTYPSPASPGYPAGTGGSSSHAGTGGTPASAPVGAADAGAGPAETGAAAPDANGGDKHVPPGTNPFVATKHDPLSTFAVDVDTASYDLFRRDINLGTLPRHEGVRLEEYVNAFAYDYPAPAADDSKPFSISVGAAAQVFDRPTVLLRVGIQGKKPPAQEKRPANLVFLVDLSGSMNDPKKLPLVKSTIIQALDVLAPTDRVSIVSYGLDSKVQLPPTPVSDRARIEAVLAPLQAAGGTNGADGLGMAYAEAQAGFIQEGINHIVLCTDGDFNIGPSSNADLLKIIREKRKTGVTLTVLGYGVGNLNDGLMETVANAGNGIYGVISSEEHAKTYVRDKLLATIVHIAKDVKIQVEFNTGLVHAYRLLGYENRAIADNQFRNDMVDAGEIGAGHRVTALYELVLTGQMVPERKGAPPVVDGPAHENMVEVKPTDLVLVKVRWKGVDATEASPAFETSAALAESQIVEALPAADNDLQWAAMIAGFAEILKRSPYADATQVTAMSKIVDAQAMRDAERTEFAVLYRKAIKLLGF